MKCAFTSNLLVVNDVAVIFFGALYFVLCKQFLILKQQQPPQKQSQLMQKL